MHRFIVCFNALFLGIIIGMIFLAIFRAPSDSPRRHVAHADSFENLGCPIQALLGWETKNISASSQSENRNLTACAAPNAQATTA